MIQVSSKRYKKPAGTVTHLITDYRLLITPLALALALSGCMGVYEGGFECPPGEGVGCKSISEVNHMVDQSSVIRNQLSVPSAQYSVISNQSSENDSRQSASFGEKGVACRSAGSCSDSLEIWYAPSFEVMQKEKIDSQKKCTTKVFDDADSI